MRVAEKGVARQEPTLPRLASCTSAAIALAAKGQTWPALVVSKSDVQLCASHQIRGAARHSLTKQDDDGALLVFCPRRTSRAVESSPSARKSAIALQWLDA